LEVERIGPLGDLESVREVVVITVFVVGISSDLKLGQVAEAVAVGALLRSDGDVGSRLVGARLRLVEFR